MNVLELFAGLGGWSAAWADCPKKHIIIGTDIKDYGFRHGRFIRADIKKLKSTDFPKIDIVLTSPPCAEFSNLTYLREATLGIPRDPYGKGLDLVKESNRLISELKKENPDLNFVMENVTNMEKYYKPKPMLRFRMNKAGRRSLWSNLTINELMPFDYRGSLDVRSGKDKFGNSRPRAERALIPYPISKYIHDLLCK